MTRDERVRAGCPDLDPTYLEYGRPRGPVLCVLYPSCKCGRADGHHETGFKEAMERLDSLAKRKAP